MDIDRQHYHTLLDISRAVASVRDRSELFALIVDKVQPVIGCNQYFNICIYDANMHTLRMFFTEMTDEKRVESEISAFMRPFPAEGAFATIIEAEGIVALDEAWKTSPKTNSTDEASARIWRDLGFKYALSVALCSSGKTIGTFHVHFFEHKDFTNAELRLFEAVSDHIAIAVANILANEKILVQKQAVLDAEKQRTAELARANAALQAEIAERKRVEQVSRGQTAALVRNVELLATAPVWDNYLGYALRAIVEQLGDDSGGVWLYDAEGRVSSFHLSYEHGRVIKAEREYPQWTEPGRIADAWDVRYGPLLRARQVLIHDEHEFATSPAYAPYRAHLAGLGVKITLSVPLFSGERLFGYVASRSTRRKRHSAERIELAQALAHHITLAIQLTTLVDQAHRDAEQAATLDERNRIAREIHDTLAQGFTGVIVQLEAARRAVGEDPAAVLDAITRAGAAARDGLAEARRSVWALRPHALEDADLALALRRLVAHAGGTTGTHVAFHADGTPCPLPDAAEAHLLRIGQEALTNALRHARARTIALHLAFPDARADGAPTVVLRVRDDGVGFDPQPTAHAAGFGLMSMRDRARQIGGRFAIRSQPGAGTEMVVTVPVGMAWGKRGTDDAQTAAP